MSYCVANQFMADGFYDYTTGVPTTYFNALKAWINTNPQTGQPYTETNPTLRTRSLKFIGYGDTTNKPANAVTFFVNFQGTFPAPVVDTGGFGGGTEVVGGGSSISTGGFGLG